MDKVRKTVRRHALPQSAGSAAPLTTTPASETPPGHMELVTITMALNIQAECGDLVQFRPGVIQHNNLNDDELRASFESQLSDLRAQLESYLQRRAKRRTLTAASLVHFNCSTGAAAGTPNANQSAAAGTPNANQDVYPPSVMTAEDATQLDRDD